MIQWSTQRHQITPKKAPSRGAPCPHQHAPPIDEFDDVISGLQRHSKLGAGLQTRRWRSKPLFNTVTSKNDQHFLFLKTGFWLVWEVIYQQSSDLQAKKRLRQSSGIFGGSDINTVKTAVFFSSNPSKKKNGFMQSYGKSLMISGLEIAPIFVTNTRTALSYFFGQTKDIFQRSCTTNKAKS